MTEFALIDDLIHKVSILGEEAFPFGRDFSLVPRSHPGYNARMTWTEQTCSVPPQVD